MADFPTNLKYLREERNLSQQEVANKTGIKQGMYSNYETGKSIPNLDILTRLAKFFRVSLDVLVGFTLDIALVGDKETREFAKITTENLGVGETEATALMVGQAALASIDVITGKEPKIRSERLIKAGKDANRQLETKKSRVKPCS